MKYFKNISKVALVNVLKETTDELGQKIIKEETVVLTDTESNLLSQIAKMSNVINYKILDCLVSVSTLQGQTVISVEEYEHILSVIDNTPAKIEGYGYILKSDLTWELYKLPTIEEENIEDLIQEL